MPGVESVEVSLNKGLASVKLKPGNTLTMQQFWQAVKRNGFTPKESSVIVRGEVVNTPGKSQLKMPGTGTSYDVVSDPSLPQVFENVKRLNGKIVSLEATLTPGKDLTKPVPLRVRKILP